MFLLTAHNKKLLLQLCAPLIVFPYKLFSWFYFLLNIIYGKQVYASTINPHIHFLNYVDVIMHNNRYAFNFIPGEWFFKIS